MNRAIHRLGVIAAVVAFCVIVLGAWVRLSHAGLGCPDWPGCYGQLTWPSAPQEIVEANQAFPGRPFEAGKAWREMVHRYLAGSLMLLVFAIAWLSRKDKRVHRNVRRIAAILVVLILFQALLGAWTVTLKLKPGVVMAHNNLGQVYVDKGDLEEALLHLEQAMELASECNDRMGTLTACSFLTEAHLAKDELALALAYGQKSLDRAVKMGFRLGEAESRERLARIHARRGEMGTARQQWSTAGELFAELGHKTKAQEVKNELAALDRLQEVQDVW